jgi:hypothetical protein
MQESTSIKLYENCGQLSWAQREILWMIYLNCGVKYGENFRRKLRGQDV